MNISDTVKHDLKLNAFVKSLHPQTQGGEEWLLARLMAPTTDTDILRSRQAQIQTIRTQNLSRTVLTETETDVKSLANIHLDSRNSEYYSQIMWAKEQWTSNLNEIGWLTDVIVFLKAILQPILLLLIPFIILLSPLCTAVVLQTPMNPEMYVNVLSKSLAHTSPIPRFMGRGGVLEVGERIVHIGLSMAMLIGGAWSQWTSSSALRGIVADMRRRATALQQSANALRSLCTSMELTDLLAKIPCWSESTLGAFGQAWNSPHLVELQLSIAGEVDGLLTLANLKRTAFPTYSESDFSLTDLWIPGAPVYNSVKINKHILLTGPNRGGKSTLLRALGTAVLMSQTFGIVFARKARLPVFSSFLSSLEPVGVLGSKSLFEAEIDFAKEVLASSSAFIMMDEIFHGTNAHDGVEAAQIFLDELYKSTSVFSVVSTHYLELPERYKDSVQALCMDASRKDDGKLEYTYRLKRGINNLSSVREILEERGLCCA